MKLDRIYTRSGDDGRTSLGDGARLPKFHVRVAAYGSIDEANSVIGIALLYVDDAVVRDVVTRIQNDLFDVGADLCRPQREHRKVEPLRVSERQVTWIESAAGFEAGPGAGAGALVGGGRREIDVEAPADVVRRVDRRVIADFGSDQRASPAGSGSGTRRHW